MLWRIPGIEMRKDRQGIVGRYLNSYLEKSIEMAEPKEGQTILDFGCEKQKLKEYIPNGVNYIGYDIIRERSDISTIYDCKPDIVIANHVLEHLDKAQLKQFIKDMKKLKVKKIIVSLPLSNILGVMLSILVGRTYFWHKMEHKLEWGYILRKLKDNFKCTGIKDILFLTVITEWKQNK